jgi:hypothetical protein
MKSETYAWPVRATSNPSCTPSCTGEDPKSFVAIPRGVVPRACECMSDDAPRAGECCGHEGRRCAAFACQPVPSLRRPVVALTDAWEDASRGSEASACGVLFVSAMRVPRTSIWAGAAVARAPSARRAPGLRAILAAID